MPSTDTDRNKNDRFSFGENWGRYVRDHVSEDRVARAVQSLKDFLGTESLEGRSFLDVGCGSGLFSLAARRLGARKIVSFDVDPLSVEACLLLRERASGTGSWDVLTGSILDVNFVRLLERADVVYAWGVLHHTGDLWRSIRCASDLVNPGGQLYIAIYNRVHGPFGSAAWLRLKKIYNASPPPVRFLLETVFFSAIVLKMALSFRNPYREVRRYRDNRGMHLWTDVRDSLGGYPYECASAGEVFSFCRSECGMTLENLKTVNNLGVNEFLFCKPVSTEQTLCRMNSRQITDSGPDAG